METIEKVKLGVTITRGDATLCYRDGSATTIGRFAYHFYGLWERGVKRCTANIIIYYNGMGVAEIFLVIKGVSLRPQVAVLDCSIIVEQCVSMPKIAFYQLIFNFYNCDVVPIIKSWPLNH